MMSEGGGPANAVDPCVWVVGLVSPLFYGSSSTRIILASPLHTMRSTRAPSPTLTSFSGISNYRTESYKPLRDKSSVPTPPVDSYYHAARTHHDELRFEYPVNTSDQRIMRHQFEPGSFAFAWPSWVLFLGFRDLLLLYFPSPSYSRKSYYDQPLLRPTVPSFA